MDLVVGWEQRLDRYMAALVKALRSSGWCGTILALTVLGIVALRGNPSPRRL